MLKRTVTVLSVLLLLMLSVSYAASPLLGKWKFKEIIGGEAFTDYVTITKVTSTGKVSGYLTQASAVKLHGYYKDGVAYLTEKGSDYFLDGWFFSFDGGRFAKHLGVITFIHDFDSQWHKLTATKLTSSSPEGATMMTRSAYIKQERAKSDALLRELKKSGSDSQ